MAGKIDKFDDEYRWLSNFWPSKVMLDGEEYPTVEHAYQAAKSLKTEEREQVRKAYTPGFAKKIGQQIKLRNDWNEVKLEIMLSLLREKFKDKELRKALLNTGRKELIEGNAWQDTFWGVCNGKGLNHLGKLLMQVREEIKNEQLS